MIFPINLGANLFLDPLQFPHEVGAPDASVRDATILPGDSRIDSIWVGFKPQMSVEDDRIRILL